MGWSHPDEDFRADHYRDMHRDEPRAGEKGYVAHRLDKPLTTAMDIVVLVKKLDNYADAAALIDQYAGMVAAAARADEALVALHRLEAPLVRA